MRELILLVNSDNLGKLVLEFDLKDLLRILLQEMDSAQWWAFVLENGYLILDHLTLSIVGKAWHLKAT